ncbi:hypothetical protein EV693_101233 [Nicoletella semolina]|uniref:Inner membrane protein YejM N-terminal domain-containing protein n=1 Tax=Nicoletella semolina TaxID=271160 RepID=A0A4V6NQD4_9PAST|nr:DUF3413 domain-containing protein [Nicoletella semolina]MDH2924138.1 hypothetical protein [Nicoletella semolina]TCP18966.1 hypothetical protein EV693_101233 [Nicoletella semolina]
MLNRIRRFLPQNLLRHYSSLHYSEALSQRITWGHWFTLFNIVMALLIASRYAFNADWPDTLLGKLYFFVSLLGHFGFIVFAVYLLLLFPLSFLIKNERTFRGISVIIATIGMTLLLVDTEVFKQFYLHLSPLVWDLLVDPDEGELSRQWQLLFVPMPLILLVQMIYSRWCWHKLRSFSRQKWGKYVAFFFLSCFSATHLFYALADMTLYRPITAQKANYPLSYPMTARTFLEKHRLIDRDSYQQTLNETGRLDTFFLNYPKNPLKFSLMKKKINFLFINLSGLSTSTSQKMPTFRYIAEHSYQLTQHHISGDSTTAGIVGLFYSLSGRYTDAILNERKRSVFIENLQHLEYQFGLFSHNSFHNPLYRRALFADFTLPKHNSNIEAITDWKLWLDKQHQPFFSYLDLSIESLQNTDLQLADIWQTLQAQNLLHNTLVLITADIAQPPLNTENQNRFAKQYTQVPMLIYWQGKQHIHTQLSSHLDIIPTLMVQFLGLNSPLTDFSQGTDLSKENNRKWLIASNYRTTVAILPNGEQYHIDRKGEVNYFNLEGKQQKKNRPPLALFLQLIQQSNQFIEN